MNHSLFPSILLLFVFLITNIRKPLDGVKAINRVRVVNKGANQNFQIRLIDFDPISKRLLNDRTNQTSAAANFTGPKILRPLLERCFFYENDSKYIFRVCPFANVTQHEKTTHSYTFFTSAFHATLGVWREWRVRNNSFDSLRYRNGDRCDQGIERKVDMRLKCLKDWTITDMAVVQNVSEVSKCVYLVELASSLFCGLGSVYSHLDAQGKTEWNVLETLRHANYVSEKGYEHYLSLILAKYGLNSSLPLDDEFSVQEERQKEVTEDDLDLSSCEKRVERLMLEIVKLKMQITKLKDENKSLIMKNKTGI